MTVLVVSGMYYNKANISDRAETKKYQSNSLGLETENRKALGISLCLCQPSSLKEKHVLIFKLWAKKEQMITLDPWVGTLYTGMDEFLTPSLKHLNCDWFRLRGCHWGRKSHEPALPSWRTRTQIQFLEKQRCWHTRALCSLACPPLLHSPESWAMHLLGISIPSSIFKITASFVLILPNSIYLPLTMQFIYKALLPSGLWGDQWEDHIHQGHTILDSSGQLIMGPLLGELDLKSIARMLESK